MDKFEYVVGVMHTNYIIYARQERGLWATGPIWLLNQMMCRAQCHKTIKLSGTLQVGGWGRGSMRMCDPPCWAPCLDAKRRVWGI